MALTNNRNLHNSKREKNDEFYTLMETIEKELKYYKHLLKGKRIYCNCDDYEISNFVKYFKDNFKALGLVSLTATCYVPQGNGKCLRMDENGYETYLLKGDGDFRSDECIEILKHSDIVVTNPPFSLFREYITQVDKYNVKFLVVSNGNSITYKDVYQLLLQNKLWIGVSILLRKDMFLVNDKLTPMNNVVWLTNLEHGIEQPFIPLIKEYDPSYYPKYDNCDAINVDKVCNIPKDYDGIMGVPISFIGKHNKRQFDIVGVRKGDDGKDLRYQLNGKTIQPYFRILIKRHYE